MSEAFEVFDGNILIYRTSHSGDVWQFRMYVAAEQRYVRKSLKTRDKEAAIARAQGEFIQYQSKIRLGETIFSITAKELRQRYLEHVTERVEGGQRSQGRMSNIKTHTKHYVDFVGAASKIQNIDRKVFRGYRAFRQKQLPEITMSTVLNESISIKQMYHYAIDEGLISQTYKPDFGDIEVPKGEVRREGFDIEEYRQLIGVSKLWFKKVPETHPKRDEEIYYRRLLNDFIVLQANLGLRTQELRFLKYADVQVRADATANVLVRADNKIRKRREVIGRRGDVFTRIKSYSRFTEADDHVFSHFTNRVVLPKDILYTYYQQLMLEVKRRHPTFDTSKTLYCLRHFWITIHLLANVDPYKIARYAGTSLTQIEKHYDNVKDIQVSREILAKKFRFDKNNEIVLETAEAE